MKKYLEVQKREKLAKDAQARIISYLLGVRGGGGGRARARVGVRVRVRVLGLKMKLAGLDAAAA